MRLSLLLSILAVVFVHTPTVWAEPSVPEPHSLLSARAVGGIGGGELGAGLQLSGQLDYWLTPRFAFGGDAGVLVASAGSQDSKGIHANAAATLRSSSGPKHWLLSAMAGPGYADANDVSCTDDLSWTEGHCDYSSWVGWGGHFGVQAGRMGGLEGRQIGLLARFDYITPQFTLLTLNFAVGWY